MRTALIAIQRLVCLGLALSSLPSLLSAQVVSGTLIEEGSGDTLEGVLVVLLDTDGDRVGGSLTGPQGRFSIQAPAPARYSVRAERIGYVSASSSRFELAPGETLEIDLVASVEAIPLEGITAAAERRCDVRPREGLAAQRLWEEARKALTATEVTRAEALVRYSVLTYEREIDLETGRVVHERSAGRAGWGERPFASVPVENLREHGFVVMSGDTATYYGPDAEVLLSDAFLDTHCFRAQTAGASEEGLIGLAFEPVSSRRIPDIRGVLWIDRETSELRGLDFRFTWLPVSAGSERFGGRLEFERLSTGAWIVRRWQLRMPLIGQSVNWTRGGQMERVVAAIREEGGEVTEITSNRAGTLARAQRAVLRGEVVDSVADAPLAGAEVYLSGTQYRTRTGPDGRFSLEVPSEGDYTVAFTHPRLHSLAILAPTRGVRLRRGEVTTTELAIPSLPTLLGAECPAEAAGAPVVGIVRDSLTGEPLSGARVILAGGAGEPRETVTSSAGSYRFCDVPSGETLTLTAGMLGRTGQPTSLVAGGAGERRDLAVALVRAVAVRGQVRDFETSQPIPAAVVQLEGADLRQVTDREGRFTFEQVTPGSYMLQIRHIGYGTHRDSLAIGGATAELDIRLPSEAIALQGVTATVSARPSGWEQGRLQGFHERRALGRGHFISREELETRRGARLTDLLRGVPGVRVVAQGGTSYTVRMARQPIRLDGTLREGETEACSPTVYIDGMRWNAPFDEIQMGDIQAIEVYRGASELPAEFGGSDSRCGVIVLWSK